MLINITYGLILTLSPYLTLVKGGENEVFTGHEDVVGFAYNSQHEFCAVLVQPYVRAKREATEEEIAEYMQALGFEMVYEDEYHNAEYEVFDAVPNNVLYGILHGFKLNTT